ncbi:MAG: hypothetical protein KA792_02780 [Bacteroidales bacterium]|nr:hypothetical protein [Bacteroidales bacterium]
MNALFTLRIFNRRGFCFFILLGLYLLSHLFFLNCDPDTLVDVHTRGAFTDEGLYTSQLRNCLNHGSFDVKENMTYVLGPMLNFIQAPVFYVFGSKLAVSRLITLAFILIMLLCFYARSDLRNFTIFFLIIGLMQFHIFQFSHYGMAEMLCVSFTMFSLLSLIIFYNKLGTHESQNAFEKNDYRRFLGAEFKTFYLLFFSNLFAAIAYAIKIQYLYIAFLPVVTSFILALIYWRCLPLRAFFYSLFFCIFFFGLYIILHYLPNKHFYDYIFFATSTEKIPSHLSDLALLFNFNFNYFLLTKYFVFYVILFCLLLVAFIGLLVKKRKENLTFLIIGIFALVWIIIEMHKLIYLYLPLRYLLSLFVALALFLSLVLSELIRQNKLMKYLVFFVLAAFLLINVSFNYAAFKRRSYDLALANKYIAKYDFGQNVVLGSWAPSLFWQNKAKTITIWNDFINDKKPIEKFKPALIISEINESDSDSVFFKQGINLYTLSDSVRVVKVWRYKIGLFWIKQNIYK